VIDALECTSETKNVNEILAHASRGSRRVYL
jgi:hypothetical protein